MKYALLFLMSVCCLPALPAIDRYAPGDTLYAWAQSGLALRREASLKAAKLTGIPYGAALLVLNEKSGKGLNNVEVEAVPGFSGNGSLSPAVTLRGMFARVVFRGDTGWVFDGYLSRLPAMRYTADKNTGKPVFENFDEYATRNFGILVDEKHGTFEYAGPESTTKKIFGNGIMVDTRVSKSGESRMILPDLSMEEAFLIFNYMNHYEWDIRHPSTNPSDDTWVLMPQSDHEWNFGKMVCGHRILYLEYERMVIITSECSC